MNTTRIRALGLMCGTSHDGLDLAMVRFEFTEGHVSHEVEATQEVGLGAEMRSNLGRATRMTALELLALDRAYCKMVADAIKSTGWELGTVDVVAIHGPTIFHQPSENISFQLGSGAVLSAFLGRPIACDFRQQDVSKGGQGAPLIPYTDKLLYRSFDFTLNLGGFCNLSDLRGAEATGYDIGPCNLLLNAICSVHDLEYDNAGHLAAQGEIIDSWLEQLNALDHYRQPPPKSLGFEWFESHVLPTIPIDGNLNDLLCTACEHIAIQISRCLPAEHRVMVTGGGAWNDHLLRRLQHHAQIEIERPEARLVNHRESIAFALLGALRLAGLKNISSAVTGSSSDTIGGALYSG